MLALVFLYHTIQAMCVFVFVNKCSAVIFRQLQTKVATTQTILADRQLSRISATTATIYLAKSAHTFVTEHNTCTQLMHRQAYCYIAQRYQLHWPRYCVALRAIHLSLALPITLLVLSTFLCDIVSFTH